MTVRKLALAAVSLAVLLPSSAMALDPYAPANFGEIYLTAGFLPDPHTVLMTAGGPIDATNQAQGLPAGCRGFVTDAPDYKLNYTPEGYSLYISALSEGDTTLIINDPNGNWLCDDDAGDGNNPLITIAGPIAGRYDIWVGTYGGGQLPATLNISENAPGTQAPPPNAPGPNPPALGMLNPNAPANYGTIALTRGFQPDPFTVEVGAGGGTNAGTLGLGPECLGYVTVAPDYSINYTAGIFPLFISISAAVDTTLIINTPNGNWICDDDTDGANPVINWTNPLSGRYDIWVGLYTLGPTQPATLRISEATGP